jgi:hypothetical protein
MLKFKIEISLLLSAIMLYAASVVYYSYEAQPMDNFRALNYPYRFYALPLTVVASVFLIVAGILYSKRK